jgi:hypothetical protein
MPRNLETRNINFSAFLIRNGTVIDPASAGFAADEPPSTCPFPPRPLITLVPKLCLGMPLGAKLCFAGGGVNGQATTVTATRRHPLHAKQSFARNGVPKQSLGTRTKKSLAVRRGATRCR